MTEGASRRKKIWWTLAVILSAVILLGNRGLRTLVKNRFQARKYQQELEKLRQQERTLKEKIQQAQSDPDYIESLARKELGMIRPEEVEYRFSIPKQKP
ncbi:MAG: cell division protein FtsL [Elusimicrobia bacterium]|nr:cell division protein FtsL [Elusimicrobiota bacterium]